LEVKKEKHASKAALDANAFAKFFVGPGGRQAGTIRLAFRIPRNDRNGSKYGKPIVRSVHFKPWEHGGQVAAFLMLTTVSLMRGEIPLPFGRSG